VEPNKQRIAILALAAIAAHLALRYGFAAQPILSDSPLWLATAAGGLPLLWELLRSLANGRFGADLLAGVSIVAAVFTREYLVATIVVLMLAGGQALEDYATRRASRILATLARRMPQRAHRYSETGLQDVRLEDVQVGDTLAILPHEICPVDGTVVEGEGSMDESYLTGEPYRVRKTIGAKIISGAINHDQTLKIVATAQAPDSRYARIMQVVEEAEQSRTPLRRTTERLGAWFTPLALAAAGGAWWWSGSSERFLATLVVATPCPLILAIPVAILGAISVAAERGIIVKRPAALESIPRCRTFLFDKTGTLTYGKPNLTEIVCAPGLDRREILRLVASAERYSKHPLAKSILDAANAEKIELMAASHFSEPPGHGLTASVGGFHLEVTGRSKVSPELQAQVPPEKEGLECVVLRDGAFAALFRFRDEPRRDSRSFISHLFGRHGAGRILLVSGDRESEARYLAAAVGIEEVHFSQSPEQKVEIVRRESALAPALFVGDGINDAPAMLAANVGVAFGSNADITSEAADIVILDADLRKVDVLLHLSRRMMRIALQSALGGMAVSAVGMFAAASGWLPPVQGAILQEIVDAGAVLNAVRMAFPAESFTDY
jgi:heavy metal translocating P-type ATPase